MRQLSSINFTWSILEYFVPYIDTKIIVFGLSTPPDFQNFDKNKRIRFSRRTATPIGH